jgi:hypothetical protein
MCNKFIYDKWTQNPSTAKLMLEKPHHTSKQKIAVAMQTRIYVLQQTLTASVDTANIFQPSHTNFEANLICCASSRPTKQYYKLKYRT